jgi:hypothetical protein
MAEQSSPFWTRVCDSLFVKNPNWFETVNTLADKLDPAVCLKHTVSGEQATSTGIRAFGWVNGGIQEEVKPNPLCPSDFPIENLRWAYLQFLFQFIQFEAVYNYLMEEGLGAPQFWHSDTVEQFLEFAQTMAFYSAMLILCEEGRLPEAPSYLETCVREEIRKIATVLTSKTRDYGQAFLRHGVVGLLYRVWDKIARYATLSAENRPAKWESRKDTVMDMLGYSVLIWSILEEMKSIRGEYKNVNTFSGQHQFGGKT